MLPKRRSSCARERLFLYKRDYKIYLCIQYNVCRLVYTRSDMLRAQELAQHSTTHRLSSRWVVISSNTGRSPPVSPHRARPSALSYVVPCLSLWFEFVEHKCQTTLRTQESISHTSRGVAWPNGFGGGGTKNIIYSTRGVNRAGPNAGRAGPGRARAEFLNCGPGLTSAGRAGPNDFIIC